MYYTIVGIILFLVSLVVGFVWPQKSWRWGLWIAGPIIILIGFSMLFTGNISSFLKFDLPLIIIGLLAASCGSFIGAWLKKRRIQ